MRRQLARHAGQSRSAAATTPLPSSGPTTHRTSTPTRLSSLPSRLNQNPFVCARCLGTSRTLRQSPAPSSTSSTTPQPQKPRSFYDLFPSTLSAGPPPRGPFSIDLAALRKEFLQLQAAAHPDRHIQPTDKARAEATSAALNDAYRTLTEPLLRARHVLLTEAGMDLEGDEGAKEQDSELLMTVLEAREVIEEAQEEGELEGLRVENERRIRESEKVLGEVMGRGEWEEAKREAVRLRYWVNIAQAVIEWEPGKPVVLVH